MPAPGSGTGSTYFASLPPGAARASLMRIAQGNPNAPPTPRPYFRNRRLETGFMFPSPLLCGVRNFAACSITALTRILLLVSLISLYADLRMIV
jgi:hypothetical protein